MPQPRVYSPIVFPYCCGLPVKNPKLPTQPVEQQEDMILEFYNEAQFGQDYQWVSYHIEDERNWNIPFVQRPAAAALLRRARRSDVIMVSHLWVVAKSVTRARELISFLNGAGIGLYVAHNRLDLSGTAAVHIADAFDSLAYYVSWSRYKRPIVSLLSSWIFDSRKIDGKQRGCHFSRYKWELLQWMYNWQHAGSSYLDIATALHRSNVPLPVGRAPPWDRDKVRDALMTRQKILTVVHQVKRGVLSREDVTLPLWEAVTWILQQDNLASRLAHSTGEEIAGRLQHSSQCHPVIDTAPMSPAPHPPEPFLE